MTRKSKVSKECPPADRLNTHGLSSRLTHNSTSTAFNKLFMIIALLLIISKADTPAWSSIQKIDDFKRTSPKESLLDFFALSWLRTNPYAISFGISLPLMLPPNPNIEFEKVSIPLTYISIQTDECSAKTNGVSAGKFCNINGDRYLLKAITADPGSEIISDTQRAISNFRLLSIAGISAPFYRLAYETNGHYLNSAQQTIFTESFFATKINHNFKTGEFLRNKATKKTLRVSSEQLDDHLFKQNYRQLVTEKIKEFGLSQLAVAGTFIQDLVYNEGNWGYDDKGLFIVDVDHSPSTLEEYYHEARLMPKNINMDFSLTTIIGMASIYERILADEKSITLHLEYPISNTEFLRLVDDYLKSCIDTIDQIKALPTKIAENEPSPRINQMLANNFELRREEYVSENQQRNTIL